ncbi:MAG: hypothetical protein HMLKMBBP_01576 [Planctomycetes bacterium]|nr:hypothetical protein [Planctomycetota bacterium]
MRTARAPSEIAAAAAASVAAAKVAMPRGSAAARVSGAVFLAGAQAATIAIVLAMLGGKPAVWMGCWAGTFAGLVSLVVEMAMVERSARTFHAQGVQTTFMSFLMRIVTVGAVTMLLRSLDAGVDPYGFALTYCGTFFLYMCWLTWVTYHAPVHYRGKSKKQPQGSSAARPDGDGYVVRDNRKAAGSSAR